MRIIIVDDEIRWRGLIHERIDEAFKNSDISIEPIAFESYDTAADALLKNPPWHLLITDYTLEAAVSDALGVELCHKANQLGIPSIVVTGQPHVTVEIVRELFIKYNIIDFYWKHKHKHNPQEFIETIRREIEKADKAQNAIKNHFRENDGWESLTTFIEKSNTRQLYEICDVLELLSPGNESDNDLTEYLDSTQEILRTIHNTLNRQNDEQMAEEISNIGQLTENPNLDIKHSVKLTVPIIPFFLTYHGELDANIKVRLEELWKRLKDRFRRNF